MVGMFVIPIAGKQSTRWPPLQVPISYFRFYCHVYSERLAFVLHGSCSDCSFPVRSYFSFCGTNVLKVLRCVCACVCMCACACVCAYVRACNEPGWVYSCLWHGGHTEIVGCHDSSLFTEDQTTAGWVVVLLNAQMRGNQPPSPHLPTPTQSQVWPNVLHWGQVLEVVYLVRLQVVCTKPTPTPVLGLKSCRHIHGR